jgi:alpha-tubulin suppressor-like RCC1 family protein
LGHNDLENYDDPELIEALAGLKVVHISAGGWHSAVVTNQVSLQDLCAVIRKMDLIN